MSSLPLTPLDSALDLATHGFYVLPVSRAEKRPLIAGWNHTAATTDPAAITRLWGEQFPDANVGVSCGPSDLVVVDVDPRHGGQDTLGSLFLQHGDAWTRTVTARTGGGGTHYYFRAHGKRYADTVGAPACGIGSGIDSRAAGGFVVAPHSLHATGNRYTWDPGYGPADHLILSLPPWLGTLLPLAPKQRARAEKVHPARHPGEGGEDLQVGNIPYLQSLVAPRLAGRLDTFDTEEAFAFAVCAFTGMPPDAVHGDAFFCVLPGHEENESHASPSASLCRDARGRWVYHDWHERGGCPAFLTLTDVFAARVTGRVRALRGPEAATWKLRLLVALGIVAPITVHLPPLPENAPAFVHQAYAGVELLFGAKWLYEPYAPAPLSWRFMADWCGLSSPERAGEAVQALFRAKVIEEAGTYSAYGKGVALYLPAGYARPVPVAPDRRARA